MAKPRDAACSAISRAVATSMVEQSISNAPVAARVNTPLGAVSTSRTCCPAGSMVMTISAPSTASAADSAAMPPAPASAAKAASTRS